MKELIKKALANRKRLNRLNKSYYRSEQFIKNLEYWLANNVDVEVIVRNWENELRLMMTYNFVRKFEELKQAG